MMSVGKQLGRVILWGGVLLLAGCDDAEGPPAWSNGSPAVFDTQSVCAGVVADEPLPPECPVADADPGAATIDIRSLQARIHRDDGDRSLQVTIQIDVKADMPHVGPDLDVKVDCDGHRDADTAFFMSLNGAKAGAELEDRLELFRVHELPEDPQACELRVQLETALHPQYWCFAGGETKPGRCKTAEETKPPEPDAPNGE
jgi:hypothetical protein